MREKKGLEVHKCAGIARAARAAPLAWIRNPGKIKSYERRSSTGFCRISVDHLGKECFLTPVARGDTAGACSHSLHTHARTWQRCCRMVVSSSSGMSPTCSSTNRLRKALDSACEAEALDQMANAVTGGQPRRGGARESEARLHQRF